MSVAALIDGVTTVTLVMLSIALALVVVRIFLGPTLPDRIVALDLLVGIVIGFIATIGIKTATYQYLDIAIALGLVGFLATVAFARFVLRRGRAGDADITLPDSDLDSRPDAREGHA
ncbi:cation:proton antiporter [Chthonobacter rhizosphaerae]|uniref:cation:proton antiporter n=1 Tax=Chthonobacter rhizosphaerae TaxID=2735553 RepID=UPI0015EE7E5E|nr:cation:proton antiporter [Chthonobacter rhizosphaerae]